MSCATHRIRQCSTFLGGALLCTWVLMLACGKRAEELSRADTTGFASDTSAREAPMLAARVHTGALRALPHRLPIDPDTVLPVERPGEYGGTWYAVSWNSQIPNFKMTLYDPPIRWKEDYTGYKPGLAKEWEFSDSGRTVTQHFRRGVRWSDGHPFTMEDMRFWWEDLAANPDYRVVQIPWWGFKSNGEPMDVEFPDEYTMVMRWDRPQWITPHILAQGFWEWEPLMKPKHYLKRFHPKYAAGGTYDKLDQMDRWWENPDYPVLFAWRVVQYVPAERTILERNAYYWKVDPKGRQLPYIDRIEIAIVPDKEVRVLELSQGKYTCSFRGSDDPRDFPFLADRAEVGGYRLLEGWKTGAGGWPAWLVNQTYVDDPEICDMLRDKRFRKAISHAMNRRRIVEVVFEGVGEPKQGTISEQAWHFQSEEGRAVLRNWERADAAYDPGSARRLLDSAGLVDRDGDGWRELPSGKKFTLIMDLGEWGGKEICTEATEAYRSDLEAVGIRVAVNNLIQQPGWDLRQREGQYMLRNAVTCELDIWTYPDWIFPVRDNRSWPMYGRWRQTGGAEGWAPPEGSPAARLIALYDKGLNEPDEGMRHRIVWEAIQIHIEEGPFFIGAAGDQTQPVVVAKNFRNVPETGILGPWAPGSPGNKHPEQFWIEQHE